MLKTGQGKGGARVRRSDCEHGRMKEVRREDPLGLKVSSSTLMLTLPLY